MSDRVWVRESFSDKWHAAESETTKRAVCGFETSGSHVWEGGNRNWDSNRWDMSRPFDTDIGTFACGRCTRVLKARAKAAADRARSMNS